MKNIFLICFIYLFGCEESGGFWLSDTCIFHKKEIEKVIEIFNKRENDNLEINGVKNVTLRLSSKNMNDDQDYIYCHTEQIVNKYAFTGIGYGDIHLFPTTLKNKDVLKCNLMHELGHNILSLRDNNNPNTLMYQHLLYSKLQECFKQPWE